MNDVMVQKEGFAARCQKVLQVAQQLFQGKPDWVTFFRETLGVSGAARSVFANQQEYVTFEKSREYAEIQNMVLQLRNRKVPGGGTNEPTRVITVRLPESLHEALKAEASDHNTSMNKLCISKLLQVLSDSQQAKTQPPIAQRPMTQPIHKPVAAHPATHQPAISQPAISQPTAAPQPAVPQPPQSSPSFRSTFSQDGRPQNPGQNFGR